MLALQREKRGERLRAKETLPFRRVVERRRGGDRLLQAGGKRVGSCRASLRLARPVGDRPYPVLRKRLERRIANRPVAGAAAKVAAKLVVDRLRAGTALAVVALEHRDDKARRAVPALRAVILHHAALHRMQRRSAGFRSVVRGLWSVVRIPAGQSLDGHDLAPGEHRQQRDAAVDRTVGRLAGGVAIHQRHGARTAIALVAAAFRTGATAAAQPVEQCRRGRRARHVDGFAVQDEIEAGSGGGQGEL